MLSVHNFIRTIYVNNFLFCLIDGFDTEKTWIYFIFIVTAENKQIFLFPLWLTQPLESVYNLPFSALTFVASFAVYSAMAQWDLTSRMGPYLDRHLVFPLLEFLSVKGIYDETDLLRAKLDLLSNTNMVDFVMDVHKSLYPDQDVPQNLKDKR